MRILISVNSSGAPGQILIVSDAISPTIGRPRSLIIAKHVFPWKAPTKTPRAPPVIRMKQMEKKNLSGSGLLTQVAKPVTVNKGHSHALENKTHPCFFDRGPIDG